MFTVIEVSQLVQTHKSHSRENGDVNIFEVFLKKKKNIEKDKIHSIDYNKVHFHAKCFFVN